MSSNIIDLIKQWFTPAPSMETKFTPASMDVNWTRVETLVHGPGAGASTGGDTNSAVFACLMAIATAYPEAPLTVMQKQGDGKSEKLPEHPLQELLDNPTPNGELSLEELLFWTAWAKHVDGNAYWLKVRAGNGDTGNVVELWPVSPTLMAPVSEINPRTGRMDWISFYKYRIAPNQTVRVPVSNVVHFRLGLDDKDMRRGLAPLKALIRQISTDEEADKFVDSLLKNYAIPGLVVTPTAGNTLTEDNADMITRKLQRKFGNENRGNIAVMSKESNIEQFGFSPKDLDMSILHRIPEERISAVMGVPAIVAGLGAGLDRATYANFKEAREMFTEQKLVPQWRADAKKLNTSLKPDFASDKNIYIEHDLTNVRALQEDEDAKYTRLKAAVGKPWITRNEARSDVGLDPVDGWDEQDTEPPAPPQLPQLPNGNQGQQQQEQQGQPQDNRQNGNSQNGHKDAQLDLDHWKIKALKAMDRGESPNVPFVSDIISADARAAIVERLQTARTHAEVKAAFDVRPPAQPDAILLLVEELKRANDLLLAANG